MQPFWEWFVTLFPMWMAPNLITLLGLILSVITVLQFVPFDANNTATFPLFTYFFGAFNLFAY